MSGKDQLDNLARRKAGKPMIKPVQLGKDTVSQLVNTGQYRFRYDDKGLHTAPASSSNAGSTWHEFHIINAENKVIGTYHNHPRSDGSFASGNLRLKDKSAFKSYKVGRATDWNSLCDNLSVMI